MGASQFVGRVGALAVFLGVGAALATTSYGIASADTGSADSAAASPTHSTTARTGTAHASKHTPGNAQTRQGPARVRASLSAARHRASSSSTNAIALSTAPHAAATKAAVATSPVSAAGIAPNLTATATAKSSPVDPNTLPPHFSPLAFTVAAFAITFDYVLAPLRQLALATSWRATPATVPALELNGYTLVPGSTEEIRSFYGNWTNWPGGPTTIQGRQQFDVRDPQTGESRGSFDALVSSGSPLLLGPKTVELLVISPNNPQSGIDPGQIPPYGSIIATQTFGPFGFGWSYSSIPSPSGTDVVTLTLSTPFGKIRLPDKFDAAMGIADHTLENSPIDLGNGYSITPADPDGETYTAVTGIMPLFSAIQGKQLFNVNDSSGNPVGSFEGVFTPTRDFRGEHTEAILVTKVTAGTVGTNPGEVPPIGSVYNVMYLHGVSRSFLYSSLPSTSGDVVSFLNITPDKVSNIGTPLFTRLIASAPPQVERLATPGGNSFYPISDFQPSGVNGLPPREVQQQGYQQFGVYDSAGNQTGSFDADVSTQWDLLGVHSKAILVTNVTSGAVGTDPGDVPPVGSVFDYVYIGGTGFGTYYSAIPSANGPITTYKLVTPLIDVPLFTKYDASKNPSDYTFYDPFAP